MWYHVSVTVPAGTPESDPVEREIKLTHGIITFLGIGFPKGCKQLVKVRIFHWEHQVFPANSDEAASWDGGIEGGQYHYVLDTAPFTLTVRAYSPDATKDHTITVFINHLPVEVAEPWQKQESLIQRIGRLLGLG